MNDMSAVIIPKSDQISADDLIAGPKTICIASVDIRPGTEQPVTIHYDGCDGRPWKPCKSMSRVLVAAWGPDAKAYIGRSVTLYRDPTVKWGGMEVGGIRISHLSHMSKTMVLALTATKGSRKPYTVKALEVVAPSAPDLIALNSRTEQVTFPSAESWARYCRKALDMLESAEAVREWMQAMRPHIEAAPVGAAEKVRDAAAARVDALTASVDHDEENAA